MILDGIKGVGDTSVELLELALNLILRRLDIFDLSATLDVFDSEAPSAGFFWDDQNRGSWCGDTPT